MAGGAGGVGGAGVAGVASMPASRRWAAVIGVGAPVSGSRPEAALGKAITSRIAGRAGEQHAAPGPSRTRCRRAAAGRT